MDPIGFSGSGVVVTGGTRGIGAAIAHAFLAAGARVMVCGRHTPAWASSNGAWPESPVSDAMPEFFQADVREPEQARALVAAAASRFGRLDVLVNNAGGAPFAAADTASPRFHAKVIELNLIAPLHVSQAANAVMRDQPGGGVILMVGSVSGVRPSPGTAAYGAAKAGLHHLATSLAMEWAPKVRVNSLVAGPVATAAPDSNVDAAAVARTVPLGRAATPAEVAAACLLLASPLAGYVSGAALAVHGGGEWPGYLADLWATAYPAQK
ncbi:NAD(P)-dependent dehydrogenase (short-subunit alcohol dehydrogenase family) [Krasilnikovia cinnamomea]|uniref:NAD(P)-dependent dehydrogenase (Short-subunit alcohol dehydrogenase family) n=1 Tax=Krasilnikovia cinnamomea TaxID=349313 RepID=A0A4Q7ZRE1_9ACTN|nr:SDR family oxidoreductase [Krasilnikovia cinnamomea]RZU53718.1 NAD(P)-dependent dehydrogenase (short-subunit alcohol dehydrogenase family) [Krasilnikovia cinnamomea]